MAETTFSTMSITDFRINTEYDDFISHIKHTTEMKHFGFVSLLRTVIDAEARGRLNEPIRLNRAISACRRLGHFRVPAQARTYAAQWMQRGIEQTMQSEPWDGKDELLAAQQNVQDHLDKAMWWCNEGNSRTLNQMHPAQPYTAHFNTILDIDIFRNLTLDGQYAQAFRACEAIARI